MTERDEYTDAAIKRMVAVQTRYRDGAQKFAAAVEDLSQTGVSVKPTANLHGGYFAIWMDGRETTLFVSAPEQAINAAIALDKWYRAGKKD